VYQHEVSLPNFSFTIPINIPLYEVRNLRDPIGVIMELNDDSGDDMQENEAGPLDEGGNASDEDHSEEDVECVVGDREDFF
ncbi:hypothetical protein, partial [Serratia marcescens]|uniref:hypothetical protein n=1 Tax=Serratia marcescens TaxID=615 RepID=UPI00281455DB